MSTYHSLFKENLRVQFEFGNDFLLVAIVITIQTEPDTTEIELFDEALADVVPLSMRAARLHSAEGRPVPIIEQDF